MRTGSVIKKSGCAGFIKLLFLCSFCMLFMVLALPVSSSAADKDRVFDNAELLTQSEAEKLNEHLGALSEKYQFDIIVATVSSLGGKYVVNIADDFFDYGGFGYGEEKDGILLLLSIGDREWAISTSGYGKYVFTDAGLAYMEDIFRPYLSDGEYAKAFTKFGDLCGQFIKKANDDTPYDINHLPRKPLSISWILGAILIGTGIATVIMMGFRSQLKTVHYKAAASDYVRKGSFRMDRNEDVFLYQRTTRVPKPKNNNSGSGSRSFGGSSTHTSSSGNSHGGSHGKF